MAQAPIKKIVKFTFGLLLSWLLLATQSIHADVAAICNVGGFSSTHATFAAALADNSCATINIDEISNITGSHTITRNLEIKGRVNAVSGGPGAVFDGENNGRIFALGADNLTVTFDYLHLKDADTTSLSGTDAYGGAIRSIGTSNTIAVNDTVFENNQAGGRGGGIYSQGSLMVTDSEFSQNHATLGGAIYSYNALDIGNSTFDNNSAAEGGGAVVTNENNAIITNSSFSNNQVTAGSGGALRTFSNLGSLAITSSSFTQNSASLSGGALYSLDINPITIDQTSFTNNSANDAGAVYAGGLSNELIVTNSDFSQNQAIGVGGDPNTGFGGGVYIADGMHSIGSTTFANNSAAAGAGIFLLNGTAAVHTSTFYSNTGLQGTALSAQNAQAEVINSTISGNDGTSNGALFTNLTADAEATDIVTLVHTTVVDNGLKGIQASGSGVGLTYTGVRLQNSIVSGHTNDCGGLGIIDAAPGYNLDSDGSCISSGGTGNATVGDVGLNALDNNGGPTQTHLPTSSSPTRDQIPAGTNGCGTTYTDDQRGTGRPQFGLCDIGAVEVSCAEDTYTFPYDVGSIVSSDHALDLRRAIACANENETADTINLTQDVVLTTVDNMTNGQNGLPPISSEIVLQGNDFALERDNSYSCGGSDLQFRLFHVAADGNLTLHDLALANGCVYTADGSGQGGLVNNAGTLAIYGSWLADSYAETSGGAIINSGMLTLSQTTLDNNVAGANGGGLNNGGSGTISQSTVSNNQAITGGGIYNNSDNDLLTLINSTISGNQAPNGAGIYNGSNDSLAVDYSTVANNTAGINSGAVDNRGSLTLTSSLIADNSTDCFHTTAPIDGGYNLVEAVGGNSCGLSNGVNGNIVGIDPGLSPLANIGGPTAIHLIAMDSAARDQVPLNTNGCGSTVTSDQQGGTRPGGVACDMGAIEVSCAGLGFTFPYTMSGGSETELNAALQCANVNGTADTITLTSAVTLTQINDSSVGNSGLVPISSAVTLIGAGYTIARDSSYSCDGSDPTFRHLLVTDTGDLTLTNLTLRNGCLLDSGAAGYGAAIYNDGSLTLTQSQLNHNNSSVGVGGALWNSATGSAIIEQSTISHNTAPSGGGIINSNELLLRNSTVSNNTAISVQAGGIWNLSSGTLQLLYSTVAANTAPVRSGGIHNSGTLILQGALIADNNKDCENDGTVTNNGDNFIEGNGGKTCGISNGSNGSIVGSDPQLGVLQDNGGATSTHTLALGSPAVDAVTGSGCPAVDQSGVGRPQGGACDMGAYELWRLNIGLVSPTELDLTWANATASCVYDVYEETLPYFPPTTVTYANQSSGVVYPQLGDVATNYFYVVEAVCGGADTAVSNTVGEFDFAIVPGS